MTKRVVRREAHAKLNVFLRLHRRRVDGYHELESLVLPLSLADRITARGASSLEVRVKGAETLTKAVPAGGLNLALVAALALGEACPGVAGAHITIEKRIPVAAGLGGGSADAAATLLALSDLWGCGLEPTALADIGSRVGSDVPALMAGGPVLMWGRGDVTESAAVGRLWWVLVPFPFGVRSPDAYRWWDEGGRVSGPGPDALLVAAAAGDAAALGPLLFNDLEPPVFAHHPELGKAKVRLLEAGALGAIMAGSGSTVAGLARDRAHAKELVGSFPGSTVAFGPP